MPGADLHLHSTASDGRFPPREVMRRAYGADLSAVSLTDHDTIAGLAEAAREASRLRLPLINGVEISVAREQRELHILGYFFDPGHDGLLDLLAGMTGERRQRFDRMISKLREAGVAITADDIAREAAGTSAVGRLHLARALVRLGVVRNIGHAFKLWLGGGGRAYVPKETPTAEEVAATIRAAGGVVVLAHPGWLDLPALDALQAGLQFDGIEVDHPSHSPGQRRKLAEWAASNAVTATGGSDWHGNENVESYLGNRRVAMEIVDELRLKSRSAPGM